MGALDETAAGMNRQTVDPVRRQGFQTQGHTYDINNGIHRAHLVEMNGFKVLAMHLGLRPGDAVEDTQRRAFGVFISSLFRMNRRISV